MSNINIKPTKRYDTIKEIADALVKINGEGEGSIKKAKQDAINYANDAIKALDVTDNAVAKSFVTKVSNLFSVAELPGIIITGESLEL